MERKSYLSRDRDARAISVALVAYAACVAIAVLGGENNNSQTIKRNVPPVPASSKKSPSSVQASEALIKAAEKFTMSIDNTATKVTLPGLATPTEIEINKHSFNEIFRQGNNTLTVPVR